VLAGVSGLKMKSTISILTSILFLFPQVIGAMADAEYSERRYEISPDKKPSERLELIRALIEEVDIERQFVLLPMAAKTAFEASDYVLAKKYADESLQLANRFTEYFAFGDAIHDGNLILGRLAVKKGDIQKGVDYLLLAGKTPGSPVLGSFGPSMSLANDLLEKGEKETVVIYFELCKEFWKSDDGRLDSWIASIRGGGKPYFGTQVHY